MSEITEVEKQETNLPQSLTDIEKIQLELAKEPVFRYHLILNLERIANALEESLKPLEENEPSKA